MMYEIMLDSELDNVCGSGAYDRGVFLSKLNQLGLAHEDTTYDPTGAISAQIIKDFCDKFKIDYDPNTICQDHFKFDGHDFKTSDFKIDKNVKLLEAHITKVIFG